jgi:small-conductance mechanosensitive channel
MFDKAPIRKKKTVHFEDVAERSLRLIDGTLHDLERLRKQQKAEREDGAPAEVDVVSLNALQKVTTALSGLLAQLRQIAKDNRDRMGDIGPTERQKLMLDYFASLPEEQMYMYLLDFKGLYDDRRRRHETEGKERAKMALPTSEDPKH